jgi:transketolase
MVNYENVPGLSESDELCVQTIRFLSMDGVQKANSGHPGMPMGMAAATYTLWAKHLKFNPKDPKWPNRDRFVLSAGHGSMLLYSMLHLTGFNVSLDDLKNFRQWESKTPGHPEYGMTDGVEVTTGPLGQGIANAVGMAIAEKYLQARYNKDGHKLIDYKIYAIAGDGCLQEGVSCEASSLAGHLKLNNLIVIYDDNHITIDGKTDLSFSEDVAKRYEAYGWNVIEVPKANDIVALDKALEKAKAQTQNPTIIKFRSNIGYSSPNFQDSSAAHGSPLGEDEIKLIKEKFGWDPEASFHVPDGVVEHIQIALDKNKKLYDDCTKKFAEYQKAFPELASELKNALSGKVTVDTGKLPKFEAGSSVATRKASGQTLDALMPDMPLVLGGSADLTPSNNTRFKGAKDFQADSPGGRYIRYGVREHAMAAIMNGISVSNGLIPYGATFMVFVDYLRAALRVGALSGYGSIFVMTHDSIGLGEDGPTHQPVEQLASLRAIPNVLVIRPADANETAYAWKVALERRNGPTVLALTRQGLPVLDQEKYPAAENLAKGGYVLIKEEEPDVLLIATGSEVKLAIEAHEQLKADGINAQIVSMPCWELFDAQSDEYKESVLPQKVTDRVGIEAGVKLGWEKWIGIKGAFIGMKSFGASAPGNTCFENFGITTKAVVQAAKDLLG